MDIKQIICETINRALSEHCKNCTRDFTYVCDVVEDCGNNTYRLTYKNSEYYITTKNATLPLHTKVHMVIPCGNFDNKFLLEDIKS